MNRTSLLTSLLLGTLLTIPAAAEPYSGDFRLTPPEASDRASSGSARLLAVGRLAHGMTGAPQAVCPEAGNPTDADWVSWFKIWSVSQVSGYVMAQNPASYVPLLTPKPELTDGQSATFSIGAAPVKKVAMCIYPTAGEFSASDVEVTITRRGLTAGACGGVSAPPCEVTNPIAKPLNHLIVIEQINDVDVEYEIAVTAPKAGSVGVHLGGRLGTYPSLVLNTN